MKKFSYKKLIDSLTFRLVGNDFQLTVHSIATHPSFPSCRYRDIFFSDYCTAVGSAALSFVCAYSSMSLDGSLPQMELYYDGRLYTWHFDRYNHIIYREYRVLQ